VTGRGLGAFFWYADRFEIENKKLAKGVGAIHIAVRRMDEKTQLFCIAYEANEQNCCTADAS
jgi:hypothetical protein